MAASKDEPSWRSNGADPAKPDDAQFDRFKALAGKLVHVPKKELDEQRKKATKPSPSVRRK